jgi:hypothetical protein
VRRSIVIMQIVGVPIVCFCMSLMLATPFTVQWLRQFIGGYVISMVLWALAWASVFAVRAARKRKRGVAV